METKIEQPTGNVRANFVRVLPNDPRYQRMTGSERARNDRMPLFRGTISSPDEPDVLHEYAIWPYLGKEGKVFFAGPVRLLSTRAGVEDHLEAAARMSAEDAAKIDPDKVDPESSEIYENPYELNPGTIIMRVNNAKILKSDPAFPALDEAAREINANRPLYWLKWQREAGAKEVRGSLWDRSGRYGPFLSGNTQYPLTREEAQALSKPDQAASSSPKRGRGAKPEQQQAADMSR